MVEAAADALGFFHVRVDADAAADKTALLGLLARALRLPSSFGGNWEALYDCLTDLDDWAPAPGWVLLVAGTRGLGAADRAALLGVVGDAARWWRERERPRSFKAILGRDLKRA